MIEIESYEYTDPILEFMRALFVRYDYDAARALIPECEKVPLSPPHSLSLLPSLCIYIQSTRGKCPSIASLPVSFLAPLTLSPLPCLVFNPSRTCLCVFRFVACIHEIGYLHTDALTLIPASY